jgi:hypothetical protein
VPGAATATTAEAPIGLEIGLGTRAVGAARAADEMLQTVNNLVR